MNVIIATISITTLFLMLTFIFAFYIFLAIRLWRVAGQLGEQVFNKDVKRKKVKKVKAVKKRNKQ